MILAGCGGWGERAKEKVVRKINCAPLARPPATIAQKRGERCIKIDRRCYVKRRWVLSAEINKVAA